MRFHNFLKTSSKIDRDIIFSPGMYHNKRKIFDILSKNDEICLRDHINGLSIQDGSNEFLEIINAIAKSENRIITVYATFSFYYTDCTTKYTNLYLVDNALWQLYPLFSQFFTLNTHTPLEYKNFIISLNGSPHVSRKLLVSALHKFNLFNKNYSTKNFSFTNDEIYGHILDEVGTELVDFYFPFFSTQDQIFNQTIYSYKYKRFNHNANFKNIEKRISESFIHLVSETLATKQSTLSEKFLYSIVSRGLFLIYGFPYAHRYLTDFLGFKKYDTIFNYRFDEILNPVERLIAILEMLGKFNTLSSDDWTDLYLLEQENIEYNYNHFFNKKFVDCYYDACKKNLIINME